MKKIVTLFGVMPLFILMIGCNYAKKNNNTSLETTRNQSDSSFMDEVLYEGNFNQKAFDNILQQLNLKRSDCDLSFVSSQVLPLDNSLTIWVIPQITPEQEIDTYNQIFTLDGYILLADTKTGKIESKSYQPNAWESDAWKLTALGIDILKYHLNNDKIMFGIYSTHQGSSKVLPAGETIHQLFVQDGESLKCIFDYVSSEYQGENDGNTSGFLTEYTTDVVVTRHKTNAFYDFALLTDSRTEEQKNGEPLDRRYSIRDSIRLYSFTGEKYEEVMQSDTAVVYTEQIGKSHKKYWYYYGKTLEQVYHIYMNEGEFATFLKKEMPKENLEYEMESDDLGEILIDYKYYDKKNLVIDFKYDEIDSHYINIMEKAGYTQLSVGITD